METLIDLSELDSSVEEFFTRKSRRKPATKASIDALPAVEISGGVNCSEECAVCLGEWVAGDRAKEMPCKHRFHGDCIDKWLNIDGSCPVCRYELPVDVHHGGRAPPPPQQRLNNIINWDLLLPDSDRDPSPPRRRRSE